MTPLISTVAMSTCSLLLAINPIFHVAKHIRSAQFLLATDDVIVSCSTVDINFLQNRARCAEL